MVELSGYPRQDGRKGIRNQLIVAYTVECAHHVAREIAWPFRMEGTHVIGFGGCAPNDYARSMMEQLCTHPNVGGVLLVSLGCENMDKVRIAEAVSASGRPVQILTIQKSGGTRRSIDEGQRWVKNTLQAMQHLKKVPMEVNELIIGTICGGSDTTSGITANPAMGLAFDQLVEAGGTAIFEETGELIGCEHLMAERAIDEATGEKLVEAVEKAKRYYQLMGYSSFSAGNAEGGLTTIEEKSLGAYSKSGSSTIRGIIKPGELPPAGGLYLLDVVPDGGPKFGWPNINDNAEITELIACGSHMVLFSTGRGSVVGSAISPVIKVCANPATYINMEDDMDINAGRILTGEAGLAAVGDEIFSRILATAAGQRTASESLGHQEFVLTYKYFTGQEPECLF